MTTTWCVAQTVFEGSVSCGYVAVFTERRGSSAGSDPAGHLISPLREMGWQPGGCKFVHCMTLTCIVCIWQTFKTLL